MWFLLAFRSWIAIIPAWAWKLIAIAVAVVALYSYGYVKGKRVAEAHCEQLAQAAQKAADAQDLQAEREGRAQDLEISNALTNQQKVDNATIEALKKDLANRKPGSDCLYDKSTADPDAPADGLRNGARRP